MKQIRAGVFETNSSSTHSFCISKEGFGLQNLPDKPPSMYLPLDENYGWNQGCYSTCFDKINYLFTVMCNCGMTDEIKEFKHQLRIMGVKITHPHLYKMYQYGYYKISGDVDHASEVKPFIRELLADSSKLKRFLFDPKSCIYTGNDNSNEQTDPCFVADAAESNGMVYVWDDDTGEDKKVKHPMYDPEHFEYYFKGN